VISLVDGGWVQAVAASLCMAFSSRAAEADVLAKRIHATDDLAEAPLRKVVAVLVDAGEKWCVRCLTSREPAMRELFIVPKQRERDRDLL
jgi:hypothetical protein